MSSGHEAVPRVEYVVLTHEESNDTVEERAVALHWLVHIRRRLEGQGSLKKMQGLDLYPGHAA